MTLKKSERADERIGLCAQCAHMRRITSDRGSVFYQCQLSANDPDFPKYPRLPVLECRGYIDAQTDREDDAVGR